MKRILAQVKNNSNVNKSNFCVNATPGFGSLSHTYLPPDSEILSPDGMDIRGTQYAPGLFVPSGNAMILLCTAVSLELC